MKSYKASTTKLLLPPAQLLGKEVGKSVGRHLPSPPQQPLHPSIPMEIRVTFSYGSA